MRHKGDRGGQGLTQFLHIYAHAAQQIDFIFMSVSLSGQQRRGRALLAKRVVMACEEDGGWAMTAIESTEWECGCVSGICCMWLL